MSQANSRPAQIIARIALPSEKPLPPNADIGFGLLLLFTWQVTAIATRPKYLAPVAILTLLLLVFCPLCSRQIRMVTARGLGGTSQWLLVLQFRCGSCGRCRRVGNRYILPSIARSGSPPYNVLPASSSGAVLEELFFRGLLFWLLFQFVTRVSIIHRHATAVTVLVIAFAFALSHTGRAGVSLFTTMLTGTAYGWMRVQSGSTAAAALMHGIYNPAIFVHRDVLASHLSLSDPLSPLLFGRGLYRVPEDRNIRKRHR